MHGLIYKLRRIDEWPSTEARLTSVDQLSKGGKGGSWRRLHFTYRAGDGPQSEILRVDSYSSLYNLEVGDTFDIQVDPANPRRIYSEEAQREFAPLATTLLAIDVAYVVFVLIVKLFGSH